MTRVLTDTPQSNDTKTTERLDAESIEPSSPHSDARRRKTSAAVTALGSSK